MCRLTHFLFFQILPLHSFLPSFLPSFPVTHNSSFIPLSLFPLPPSLYILSPFLPFSMLTYSSKGFTLSVLFSLSLSLFFIFSLHFRIVPCSYLFSLSSLLLSVFYLFSSFILFLILIASLPFTFSFSFFFSSFFPYFSFVLSSFYPSFSFFFSILPFPLFPFNDFHLSPVFQPSFFLFPSPFSS